MSGRRMSWTLQMSEIAAIFRAAVQASRGLTRCWSSALTCAWKSASCSRSRNESRRRSTDALGDPRVGDGDAREGEEDGSGECVEQEAGEGGERREEDEREGEREEREREKAEERAEEREQEGVVDEGLEEGEEGPVGGGGVEQERAAAEVQEREAKRECPPEERGREADGDVGRGQRPTGAAERQRGLQNEDGETRSAAEQ
eukprot:3029035-Rhodomonas_salina.1